MAHLCPKSSYKLKSFLLSKTSKRLFSAFFPRNQHNICNDKSTCLCRQLLICTNTTCLHYMMSPKYVVWQRIYNLHMTLKLVERTTFFRVYFTYREFLQIFIASISKYSRLVVTPPYTLPSSQYIYYNTLYDNICNLILHTHM